MYIYMTEVCYLSCSLRRTLNFSWHFSIVLFLQLFLYISMNTLKVQLFFTRLFRKQQSQSFLYLWF